MVSTPTPSLQLEIPSAGDYRGQWAEVMQRLLTQIDKSIAGLTSITTTGGTINLTDTQYQDNQTRQSTIAVAGALTSNVIIVVPARSKRYTLINKTTGAFSVSIKTAAGAAMGAPAQGSIGDVRVDADGSIMRIGPYVDRTTGAVTSTNYALQTSLQAEIDRATAEEATLIKRDGTRAFTSVVSGVAPTANAHLATKKYVDDATGLQDAILTTAGSASAFTVTTGNAIVPFDGLTLSIRLHATNDKDCTLSVDGSPAKPIRGFTGKSLSAGVGIAGTPYRVIYVAATQEWIFSGFFQNPYQVPIGGFLPFCSTTVPNSNFILPFGQALSRSVYAELYNLIGTSFGAGDGVNTFNAPDLRGRAIVGLDNMGGAAAGRITVINGSQVGAFGGADNLVIPQSALPNVALPVSGSTDTQGAHTHPFRFPLNGNESGGNSTATNGSGAEFNSNTYTTSSAGDHLHTVNGNTGSMNGGVNQTALNNLQPSLILPFILRVI